MAKLNQGHIPKKKRKKIPKIIRRRKTYNISPLTKNVTSIYSKINLYQKRGIIGESNERILRTQIYNWAFVTSKKIERLPDRNKQQIRRSRDGVDALLLHSDSMELRDLIITFSDSIQRIHINATKNEVTYQEAFGFPVADEWQFAHIRAEK